MNKVVFLPGWGMEESVWNPLLQNFPFSVHCSFVHWRGIERLEEFEERVTATLAHEEQAVLVGWSLGSLPAIEAAFQDPGKISHLILIGGTARFTTEEFYPHGWKAIFIDRMKRNLQKNREITLEKFYESMFSCEDEYRRFQNEVASGFQGDTTSSLLVGLDYLLQQDVREYASKLKMPVLLLHGEEDKVCPAAAAKFIKQENPNVRVCLLPDAGHAPHITKAAECAAEIMRFLEVEPYDQ